MLPAPTRRKACQNCAAAKRRCPINLPRCSRCAAKGLECSYDLEPLPGEPYQSSPIARWHGPSSASKVPLHCLLERLSTVQPQHWHNTERLRLRRDPTGVAYIIWAMHQATILAAAGAVSPFIHPKRQHSPGKNQANSHVAGAVATLRRSGHVTPTDESFTALLRLDPAPSKPESELVLELEDVLDITQALMLYLAALLCGSGDNHQQRPPHNQENQPSPTVESWFRALSAWTALLEQQACRLVVRGLAPWQAWLLGETTRRAILTSDIFTCIFSSKRYELPGLKLRIEALPFDGRAGLWRAESPQAWAAAAGARRGADVQTRLVSFHEFGCGGPEVSLDADGDLFLAMVRVAHNGIDETADDGQ